MSYFPLFDRFPRLAEAIPRLELGDFPTPVQKLASLGRALGTDNLFVKRDDLSAAVYGGNKVRKLALLLAEARSWKATTIVTCGGAGSNHALATAIYGKQAGFRVALVLVSQPPSTTVRNNLLGDWWAGAELHHFESYAEYAAAQKQIAHAIEKQEGFSPMVIPVGGTTPRAIVGFVNASFELAAQVEGGALPAPSNIVVPFGSMGTALGLAVGAAAAGLSATRVTAVRVVPDAVGNEDGARSLWAQTVARLTAADPVFPTVKYPAGLVIEQDYYGEGYGVPTEKAERAIAMARETEGLSLDPTYSGKAFAAFLDLAAHKRASEPLLFWDTFNSRPLPAEALAADYRRLPPAFHRYFEG